MSIKSIPLKTWEVQATLDDRKSTMRRVVKPHNAKKAKLCEYTQGSGLWVEDGYIKDYSVSSCWMKIEDYIDKYYIYKPGDILWVRETWAEQGVCLLYKANFTDEEIAQNGYWFEPEQINWCELPKWHPSIHMPREAARLFLRVKAVRVERLRDIECIATEGITMVSMNAKRDSRYYFAKLWNSTIKPADLPRYGWDANQFVWVVEFERCERPEGWL